jgi:hypothetical protein
MRARRAGFVAMPAAVATTHRASRPAERVRHVVAQLVDVSGGRTGPCRAQMHNNSALVVREGVGLAQAGWQHRAPGALCTRPAAAARGAHQYRRPAGVAAQAGG